MCVGMREPWVGWLDPWLIPCLDPCLRLAVIRTKRSAACGAETVPCLAWAGPWVPAPCIMESD